MNRLIKLKDIKDSIVSSEYILAKSDIAMLLWQGNKSEPLYNSTIETPTRGFEPFQDCTNGNANEPVIIGSRYEESHTVVSVGEEESIGKEDVTTWINNSAETIIAFRIQRGSRFITDRLKKFANLKTGWDSYDAKSIQWKTIIRAIQFFSKVLYEIENKNIPVPFVAPLSDGGIQFEWKTCYKELILLIPEKEEEPFEYLKVDKLLWKEQEEEDRVFNIDEMVNIAKNWLL